MKQVKTAYITCIFAHRFLFLFFFSNFINDAEAIEECIFKTDDPIKGRIGNQDINETFIRKVNESALPLDCLWMIEVKPDWQVRVAPFAVHSSFLVFYFVYVFVCVLLSQFHNFIFISKSDSVRRPHTIQSNNHKSLFFPFAMCPVRYVLFSMYFF